jgi:hypothetical protein
VAEGAGQEGGDTDVGTVARRRLHREARQRQLADVELCETERAEEDLLRTQVHDDGVDAVDGDAAVAERAGAVVFADGNGETKPGHAYSVLLSMPSRAAV